MFEPFAEVLPPEGAVERWSAFVPDGLLADMLSCSPAADSTEWLEQAGAWEKLIAFACAGRARALAGFATAAQAEFEGSTEDGFRSAAAQVAVMLGLSPGAASGVLGDAVTLDRRLPQVLSALAAGRMSYPAARAICEEFLVLPDGLLDEAQQRILERVEGRSPAQVRACAKRVAALLDAGAVHERAERARRERFVRLDSEPDGMATLSAYLPAAQAIALYETVDDHARRTGGGPGESRAMDARRADALWELLTQSEPEQRERERFEGGGVGEASRRGPARTRVRAEVRVTVPLSTLLGTSDLPGELSGYGPIPAHMARELAADPGSTWRRLVTDPLSGALLDHGMARYRPAPSLAAFVAARAQTCGFPGCRKPAERCDIDHHEPYDPATGRGPTRAGNLGPFCRAHHRIKQFPGWSVMRNSDGTLTWTLPSGHRATQHPPQIGETSLSPVEEPDEPPF